jgi:sn-glycerol 3-phosphate transport system ATP-binding protein
MAYGLRNLRTPKPEIDARVREAARILELDSALLTRMPRQLSGGQRQRVAMGRAIVRKPAAFLFDEPLSNLDAKLRVQMRLEIRKLQKALRTTSLYVTHDQLEAMTLADLLVVMNGGRVEQVGEPLHIYEYPASVFVAGFIGSPSMNFLPCVVAAPGVLRLADGSTLAYEAAHFGPAAGAKVIAGVRPERVQLGEPREDNALKLQIELIEELGAERLVHGRLAGEPFIVTQGPGTPRPDGTGLAAAVPAGAVHIFDAATGRRL